MATNASVSDGHRVDNDRLHQEADLAQAFKDVAKGEKTATALEHQLTKLESKIDDLLASAEEQDQDSAAQMLSGDQRVVGEDDKDRAAYPIYPH